MEDKNIKKRKRDFRRKKISKKGKTDGSTNSDVLISLKDAKNDDDWYRLLKPGFKSKYEITD